MPKLCSTLAFGLLASLMSLGHSASVLKPRYNNPSDHVKDWVALGDSYSAGPGAGAEFDRPGSSGACMRRDKAYAPTLQNDNDMIGPDGPGSRKPTFKFASCTGDTTADLLDFSDPNQNQLNKISSDTTFATLSIGGNDVFFAPILKGCVFGTTTKRGCEGRKAQALKVLFGQDFYRRYNDLLTQIIVEKFRWSKMTHDTTVLYHTSYIQFFDDFTDQCDGTKFLRINPKAPQVTKDLRRSLNLLVHQLNEVFQYWIDLRNDDWVKFINKDGEMRMFVSPVHFVDMDPKYMDHRFCREGVVEPDRDTLDTWFFHAPAVPLIQGQENNQTYLDEVMDLYPFTWQPGRPGEPAFNASISPDSDPPPFDPNDPLQKETDEKKVRTFHPTPAGFAAEAEQLKYELYRRNNQRKLSDRQFYILCIGDFSALGEGYEFITPDRYGFIPYLQAILRHADNFDNKPVMHRFIGSQKTGYAGDVGHEIYPDGRWYGQIARWAASTKEFQLHTGKVVPIMMGAKDLQNQRPINDILQEVHWLLQRVWQFDEYATVLLASVPMMGDPIDNGSEWWNAQKAIIEFNAQLAQIVNYYAKAGGRHIVYVHLSATQRRRIKNNPYVPDPEGYHRIAYDFLNGLVQANDRGFFAGDRWGDLADINEIPGYELQPLKENEVTNGIKCHQRRKPSAPEYDTMMKSLFRGAKDQDDWIENYACNKTFVCKFSWDADNYNTSAPFPFSEGKTCITAGGDNDTHTTAHQFLVRRENAGDDLGDWCTDNLKDILDHCVKDGEGYGGYWGDGKNAIYLSNVEYKDDDVWGTSATDHV